MNSILLTLPYPPSVNHLYATVHGRRVLSKAGREFKERAGWKAKEQGAKVMTGDLCIVFRVYRPRRSGDLDNRIKATQDALKGICFKDDAQISQIHAYRHEDKHNPRVVVELSIIE